MKVKVLGCSGGILPGKQSTCFRINKNILIDAGAAASTLALEEQVAIEHVFISHPHFDHIRDLPFLCDNRFGLREDPLYIYSTPEIIGHLKTHIFNGVVWPDFSVLPNRTRPSVVFKGVRERIKIDGVTVRMYSVNHPCDAIGFIVEEAGRAITLTGDTGPTELLWRRTNATKNLKAIFTEISFPSSLSRVAEKSGHFTPATFLQELSKIHVDVPLYAYHLKPKVLSELMDEIQRAKIPNLTIVQQGDRFSF